MMALGNDITRLVKNEGIAAADICLLYNGKSAVRLLETKLAPRLTNNEHPLSPWLAIHPRRREADLPSFMRHNDEWFGLHDALTVDECLSAIQDDAWFTP